MPHKSITNTLKVLYAICLATDQMVRMVSPKELQHRAIFGMGYVSYKSTTRHLEKRGLVKIVTRQGQKFLEITKKGKMEVLLAKARIPQAKTWDGKWRMIIFDIPKPFNSQRDKFRRLLRQNDFIKLQGSVYISPHPLNREAIEYLTETNLVEFIRIVKVEEMDKDEDLKKKFGLK